MAGEIFRNWRILAATLFSIVLVIGAYGIAKGIESPSLAQASTESALLQAIATKDSNGDGLPDWEKSLYGIPIDSATTDYFHLGMTDGEAVAKGLIVPKAIADISVATSAPGTNDGVDYAAAGLTPPSGGTLTDAFAKNFFTRYVAAKQANGGSELSAIDIQNLQEETLSSLITTVAPSSDFKSLSDLFLSASDADAFKTFAANAETVFKKNKVDATMTEINYLAAALQKGDQTALSHIAAIAKADRDIAAGLAALPVPKELAADDLLLINALMHLSGVINDFARVNTDPLTTMLALQQYVHATQTLWTAFTNIGNDYSAAGVVLPAGAPGASFVNLIADIAKRQAAATP